MINSTLAKPLFNNFLLSNQISNITVLIKLKQNLGSICYAFFSVFRCLHSSQLLHLTKNNDYFWNWQLNTYVFSKGVTKCVVLHYWLAGELRSAHATASTKRKFEKKKHLQWVNKNSYKLVVSDISLPRHRLDRTLLTFHGLYSSTCL